MLHPYCPAVMGLRYMPPRGGSGVPRLHGQPGFLSAAFWACRALVRALNTTPSSPDCVFGIGGLLLAVLLVALPLQAVAQTQGVSISEDTAALGQYVVISEGQKVTFTVSRTGDNSNALTVNYTISDGGGPADLSAEQAGEADYTSDIPTSYEFPAGSSASHEFSVTAVDDEVYEPNQYFTLTASGSYQDQGSTMSFSEQVIVRIRENDERYLILSPVSDSALVAHPEFMAKEGGTGKDNQLTISLNEPLPYNLDIGYTVGDDPHTTASVKDFTMSDGTVQISTGDKSVAIDIDINDDQIVEPTEYFTLRLRTPDYDDPGNALGTFNQVNFQESKVQTQPLSVSIMDNDTQATGGAVYLRGEGGGGITGFPSTRKTLTEGQSTTITAEIAGAAPQSDIQIPLKFDHYPSGEATSADYRIDKSITIKAGQKTGAVTLRITDDTDDERYRELLVVEIDDTNFPTSYVKGDRSKYEVIMLDNDKTPATLLMPSATGLTEAAGARTATFELRIDRRPKAAAQGAALFTGADSNEGEAKFVLEYAGTATRGADYSLTQPTDIVIGSTGSLPNGCSASGEGVTCTVTLDVKDDDFYEGGSGTTESVQINLNAGGSSFNDGIKRASNYESLKLTIEDDDLQPMFSIAPVKGREDRNLTFQVQRSGARWNDVSVTAGTGDHGDASHPAKAGTDYTKVTGKTLKFPRGTNIQTFEVAVTDDIVDEPEEETFVVNLRNPVDNQGLPKPAIATGTAVGTITDNDDAPTELTISVDTDTSTDGDQNTIAEAADTTTVSVTATIDSPTRFATDQIVIVTVGKEGDGAVEGTDYEEVADTIAITIPATEVSGKGTFELTPENDSIDDDDEKISVEGALTGMTVTDAAITITDDDTRSITVDPVTLTLHEADDTNTDDKENEDTYEVALTSQPEGGTVTVNIESEGPKVATVDPPSLKFDADNWKLAQMVTITAKNDTIDDTGEQKTTTITHTVSAAGTDYKDETVEDVAVTVTDDDDAPMALTITVDTDTSTDGEQDKISEGADSPTVRITATLGGDTQFATDKTITINVGDSEKDSATEGTGGDYNTVAEFNIILPAGAESVSHDLTLTLNDDDVDEPDETVTVAGELARVMVTDSMFTIEDNDATPTVTLVLTPASINESGATNASTVTATMDGTSSEAATLTVSATPVSPAVAGDLTLSENKTLTIPANTQASTGVVTIAAVDNDVDAANKTVTVAATATGGNALVQAPGIQTLTITDDDIRGITVSKMTLTLDEEDNTATMEADEHQDTYTVVLDSEPSGGTVTIGVASGDTTIAGVAPATLAFTASNWDEPQTVIVTAVADGIDNPNDRRTAAITHTVTATGTDYDSATASGVTVTVNDDDGAPTLSINSPSVAEVDNGATATLTFTVRLAPNSGNTVTVDYVDAGTGTATSGGTDYATLANGTLTFAPGVTSQSVAVTVSGDDIDELDETVVVRLSSPSNATLTGGATTLDGTGTINDNDPMPTVSVADATAVTEGDVAAPNPANNMTFAVTLSAPSGLDVTVPYILSGTATAGTDYTEPDPRSVTISTGTTRADIAIPLAGDEVDEENETITVTLGTPTNATVSTAEGAGAASGMITDDDTRGVSVTPTELTVDEADNAGTAAIRENQDTYKVVLTSQPTGAVTVNLKSGDESVARIDTASLVFDADDWNSERTVAVTGQADVIDNTGDERATTIAHTVSAAGTDYADETAEGVAVTVTDDDAAPSGITLTANPDSVTENGGAKTITVTAAVNGATRYAQARTVSVSVGGGTAISGTDYTAVESFDITIGAGGDDANNTFTLTPENDVLAEGNETIDITGTLSGITITPDEITFTDDDAVPSGIMLSVDTNGAEDGAPSTVAEDAGATVVTVTATVNGTTRYVDVKTVAVSVADGTAESPADYAAVSNFNITIAAGAASHTGSFTVTPVDDDLDEANETIDVTGTLSSVTITPATVTFTDNDDPVSFSIADAEADEGGKVTFMVSRAGAEDNVASVKVTTATDSGDGADAADADDYTAIATAQTVNFAKGVASQTVEVQTTQDDLFEPDETFLANLSAPALGDGDPGTGVSIAAGKGTATGTIRNDDTEPSFAVADASAAEGNGITFTVTRSGAMDNAVSVKWNTKPDTGAGAASATDYTPVTAATTLSFARGVSSRTFTVATTEDVLAEGNETFLVELTGAVGATISTAEATGTINDDDAAPTGITLSVDADTGTNNVQSSIAEEGGVKTVRVTATIGGTTRFATAQTVTVTVGKDSDSATEGTDYSNVAVQSIEIPIGAASAYVDFMLTPTTDVLSEGSETISVEGTLTDVTFTNSSITITDDDAAPSAITLSVDADTGTNNVQSSIAEEGGVKTVRVTATIDGTTRFATEQTVTVTVGKAGDSATEGTDYAMVGQQSIDIPIGDASAYVDFMLTPTTDVLFEGSETISVDGTLTGVAFTNSSITITDDDAAPSAITLSVDTNAGGDGTPTALAEGATATTVRVTATITSTTRFATEQTVKVIVGKNGDSATEGTDYALVADQNIKIPAGAASAYVDFSLTPTHDILNEPDETISVDGELTGVTFAPATITINDDDAAPQFITLAVDTNAGGNGTPTSVGEEAGATTVRVTATITSATRFSANQAITFEVGKSADSAEEGEDYTEVGTLTITIDGGDASGYVDFTLTPTSDVLDELNETISVHGTQANITFTDATITITDNDAAPSGITLSVDTNGSTAGMPSTVAEDAGATVVTVTATVNGTTRYVDAKTVAVSVDDDTAASPADYAAVSGFNITIAAGAASHTGSFTVTPVDDDLDESNETIDVTGTLTDITITGATVTLTDTDDPVSFSIADAEATEGGKVEFTVSRGGAEDNVASVKVATAADSGDDVNAADTDDYTAIATAQTLNFAAGVTSQTVEVQTTQDDLFELDETFKAVLSAPALAGNDPGTGVSIEAGKGTATGTIKNDDTEPSFAVADASASEGDAITFTVTRSGAMDNAVSVKWNTKADSSDGANAASANDYTRVTTAQTLTFAKGVSSQNFTVATTEDVLDEENETFLVELTGAVGATIATAQATGTINDDDAAPSGITLAVSPATVGEGAGETEITVTATVNGTTRYVDAKTVTVSVGGGDGTAISGTDYDAVANFDIVIAAGDASKAGAFDLTPTDDDLHEGSETIDVTGTSNALTITKASITLEDDDAQPSFAVADASASEGDAITFTVTRSGAMDNAVSVKWNTRAATGAGAASASDYTEMTTATKLDFAKGVGTQTFTVATTEDTLNEANETFLVELTKPVGATITDAEVTGTITNDDAAPTTLTLAVDADNNTENVQSSLAENGGAKTVKVTATLGGSTQFDVDKTLTLIVGDDDDSATEGADYTTVADITVTIPAGDQDVEHTFTLTPTDDAFREDNETISFDATLASVIVTGASITLTSDDAAPSITLTVDADKDTDNVQTSLAEDGGVKTVRVTATLDGTTRLEAAADLTLAVGKNSDSAMEGTDYTAVADRTITIGAGVASVTDDFTLTPTNDDLYEGSETISLDGTLTGVTVTDTSLTLTDDDAQPSFAVADASASEGDAITFTVTRSGAMDNVVSVKWNTKAASGAGAAATTDYTAMPTATKLDFAKGVGSQTFTVATTEDTLHEGAETFLVELTEAVGAIIGDAEATGTINDDDTAPSGITLSVDTNGSTAGMPSTVAEDAGATVVTVTATVNGTTRYVDAKTVAVSVDDDTAASPADYAAVSGFNITIAAGVASHTGSFTVTPVDDDLDESNETIDVTGTLTDITITGATVTLTDTDDPVSFSIADAEATEGGKVEFTVSRGGAEDNVASVKVATAADSGDDVNAADTDDYTAIATAQTLNFAAGVTSQTVEVQTTQDDLFELDETFKAVLSAPALAENDPGTGVSIEAGKGTATGTIKNDDTEPSFAVADASASEGDAITFTVTRSGAMDNAVSVKWNTKADSSDGANAASANDYTRVTTAQTLTFAKGVSSQNFTVATTEDVLDEENETFLVELTGAVGATIATAQATGTITDDDAAPTGITLTVSPATVGEGAGETEITVTATVNGSTRYVDAKTLTVSVGGGTATSDTDYDAVANFDIVIAAGDASKDGTFDLTPTQDDLHEGSETINLDGTVTGVTVTDTSLTLTDDDGQPSFAVTDASASEGETITFTVTRSGAMDNAVSVKWNTKAATGAGAAATTDYTAMTTATKLDFAKGVGTQTFTVATTEDTLHEGNETFLVELTEPVGATITDAEATGTITNDDAAPTTLTLAVDADNNTQNVQSSLAENGGAKTVKVTATLGGSTQFDEDKDLTLIVGKNTDSATEGTDYTNVADVTLTIPAGDQDVVHTFTLTPTDDTFHEASETISFDAAFTGVNGTGLTVSGASITLTSDDAAAAVMLTVDTNSTMQGDQDTLAESGGATSVTVTATLSGATRFDKSTDLTLIVGDDDADSATEGTDYTDVANQTITISANAQTASHTFTLTPTDDAFHEANETISLEGTLAGVTVSGATITLTSEDVAPAITLTVDADKDTDNVQTSLAEDGGGKTVRVTAALDGTTRLEAVADLTLAIGKNGDSAMEGVDYTTVADRTITIAAGVASVTDDFTLTPTNDDLYEGSETISLDGTLTGVAVTDTSLTLTDDDSAPSGIALSVSPATVGEEDGETEITVTATVSGTTRYVDAKTVTVSVGGGTATSDTDYDAVANFDIVIAAGDASKSGTFDLTPTQDDLHEGSETIDVTGASGSLSITKAAITLTDDDGQPSFAVADASANEGDAITFTVTRSGAMDNAVSVKWNTKADTGAGAAATTDYTAMTAATKLDFASGASSQTFTFATTEDTLHEGDETFLVELTEPVGGIISDAEATGTITDDDAAPTALTLSVDADTGTNNVQTSLAEDGGAKTVRVTATLSGGSTFNVAKTVSVEIGADADSAAEGTDYGNVGTQSITINAGSSTGYVDFTLTPTQDVLHEGNETISLVGTLTSVMVTDATITLTDDDAAPSGITLAVSPATVGEGAGETEITVTATVNGSTRYVDAKTVTVSVGGGTATSDTDYDAVANFDIVIAAGDASKDGTFDLTPTQDDLHEGSETIGVDGTVTGVTVTDASLTLTDDDGQPSFAVADASADEGDTITFTVIRSGAMDNAVSVKWNTKTATGTGAAATTDYTATTTATKLDFASGASSQTFTVATTEDTLHEGNETFLVELTEPVGAIISDSEATGTITDDDAAPTALALSVDADTGTMGTQTSLAEDGGAKTVRVTATLGGSSTFTEAKTVTVEVGPDADGATEGTDYAEVTSKSITINAGELSGYVDFTLTPTDDDIDEPSEGISIEGTLTGVTVTGTSFTITDDEGTPTVTLVLTPTTINESGNGNASTVTATLSGESSAAVTVEVSVPNDAPVTLSTNTTLTIAAGSKASTGTVSITAVDNDVDAPNAAVVVSGAASGGGVAVANPADQTLTITDDEGTPTVTLVLTPTTINESGNGNSSTVTAMLSGKSSAAVTLTVAAAAGANTAAADFTLSATTTLTIAAGATTSTGTVTITAVDNDVDAPNKTVTVSAAASGGGVANPGNQTLTIADDEGIPTVTLALDPTTINESGNGNSSTVTAMLSGKSSAAVTVTVSVPNDAPVTLSNNATLSIAAGATASTGAVTITAVDNDVDAANASVLVSGVAAGGSVANPADQTLTITDDEGTPTVTLVLTPSTINESGGTNSSTVTAMLSGESSAAVTLTVAAAAGADTAAGDFTLSNNTTLTIAAGATTSTGTVTITAVDNNVDAPNKTVTVSATASGGGVAHPTDQTLTITDDEGTPTVTLVLTPSTINESGGTNSSTVTATLSGESSAAVTVEVSVPNAAPVTLSGNTTLTIAPGAKASTGTVTITAVDNDVDAPNASVVVSGESSGGGVTNPMNQTLTITDDEGTPTATLVLTPTTINESGNGNASTVTATLSGKSNTAVTLTVAAEAGADTATGDFTVSATTTLTIAAGATTGTGSVKITAVNNDIDAPNKTVTVSATASGGGVANPDNQTLTITDDDSAPTGIALSVSPATLGEGDGLTRITVTATVNGSTRYVDAKTVTVSVGSGTAISGTDFDAVSNFDITIAAAGASQTGTFDLTPTDDALHEEDETIEVTGTSGALTITPAMVTITDNDAAGPVGTVSLSASRYEVLEGDSLSVTVNLSESPAADTMIELEATSPGGYSATPGADYDAGVQTVTIRAGKTSGKARIWTTRDNQSDPNETFTVAIRASELPGTVTLGEPDTAVVTIRERVSGITPPETATVVYAGRNSRISMPVPAGLKGHGIDVAFYFDMGPGTARGGGDCREPGTDLVDFGHFPSFPQGTVRTGPVVRIAEDINTDTIELEVELCKGSVGKTFTATWDTIQWLGNPDRGFPGVKSYPFNAAAAHCTSTVLCWTEVTIVDNAPVVLADPEVTIAAGDDITEGGDAVFTVQASPAPASDLEIALAIADDAVSDFLADGDEGSKTVTIAAGSDTATYTLATTDDGLEEVNGGVSATLEARTGYQVGSQSTATVAVADNDDDDHAPATVVRITGGAEITEGGVARFTLTSAPAPSQDITVNLRVTHSGAFAGDGELGERTVTLGTDATVTVDIPTVDDSTLEDDGSLTITVEPGTDYAPHATDASATVAVADDEVRSLPTIHIDDAEAAEGEDLHFTFTLSHAVDHEVDVWWETRFGPNPNDDENGHGPSYGEAIPHADFRYADSRVTVYPGSTRGEFWVETFDDSHDEGRETLTVVLTDVTGAVIADELAIGTIINSDPMPAAWLARFGRAVTEQALDGIAGRIAAPRTAGRQGMVAGQALSFGGSTGFGAASPHGSLSGTNLSERARQSLSDIARLFGDERATGRSRTLSGRDLLPGSRFMLTGERDATGGNLAFWGRAAQSGFDGREGRFSLDGDAGRGLCAGPMAGWHGADAE